MVDRTDIDALLIGALYGELTPADAARLTAHLESHPADRTALDQLTRTRAVVRDSRILAFQLEPPHAISALLLQEASRRAPRAATARGDGETASWFQRFVRSFMAHPAMAAAAMLVLVVTAAGTFYLRGTDQFASSAPPSVLPDRAVATETAPPASAVAPLPQVVPIPEPQAAHTGALGDPGPAGAGSSAPANELSGYARPPAEKEKLGAAQDASRDLAIARQRQRMSLDAPTMPAMPARVEKADRVRGIELRTPQLAPKDLQDNDEKPALPRGEVDDDGRAPSASPRNQRASGAAPGGGAPPMSPPAAVAAQPAAPPPSPSSSSSSSSSSSPSVNRGAGPGTAQGFEPAQAAEAPAKDAKRAPPRPVPTTKPMPPSAANSASNAPGDRRAAKGANPANTANADAKQAEDKSARDPALLAWARKQREQVIALVSSNRCVDAASAAVEIYNRAPDYFNANVATDRQIRPCLAYVNNQRERANRARAASKSAADVQAPAPPAPTRK